MLHNIIINGSGKTRIYAAISTSDTGIPNSNSFRFPLDFSKDPITVLAVEKIVDNVWTIIDSPHWLNLGNSLLKEHMGAKLNLDEMKKSDGFYLVITEVKEDDGFGDIKDITDDLTKIINAVNVKLDERSFRNNYMLLFVQDSELMSDPDYEEKLRAGIRHWTTHVASPMQAVDVVDNYGNVLFTVPSLAGNDNIVDMSQMNDVGSILSKTSWISQTTPSDAEQYFEDEFSRMIKSDQIKINGRVVSKETIESIIAMDKVREYYGFKPFIARSIDSANASESTAPKTQLVDDIDDDDFS